MTMSYTYIETPVGRLLVAGDDSGLCRIEFDPDRRDAFPKPTWQEDFGILAEAIRQLDAYFAGTLRDFDLPLQPSGTPFQLEVWQALRRIPYGTTISYGELAHSIGRPNASRAVGAANGQNPLPIVVPCHRVIGSTGSLTGFGGGLEAKSTLLALEAWSTGLYAGEPFR
jgi:methylated-DNA-[protein]-cysteine S-methyltransferase